jgi:ketosteroid isomerase-like protein
MTRDEREVLEAVEAMNRCWTKGDPDELRGYFHEHMVAVTPGARLPLIGREACVAGWAAYARSTKILAWETGDVRVRVHGDAAVVSYLYEMDCERDGRRFRPAGRDLMMLSRHEGRWQVVADSFSSYPEG